MIDKPPSNLPNEVAKQLPDFGLSGLLAKETNTVNGVFVNHSIPPDARIPNNEWRLYLFKSGDSDGHILYLHRQMRYIIGKDERVADIPALHDTVSKQHAVIVHRFTKFSNNDEVIIPYIMDLNSTNGTFLNGERIDAQRYYELKDGDSIRVGRSSREYVVIDAKRSVKQNGEGVRVKKDRGQFDEFR